MKKMDMYALNVQFIQNKNINARPSHNTNISAFKQISFEYHFF